MQQQPFLKLLPLPVYLEARLGMIMLSLLVVTTLLIIFTLLDIFSLPTAAEGNFVWIMLGGAVLLLFICGILWWILSREVLRPLTQLREVIENPLVPTTGLNSVAERVKELSDTIHRTQAELSLSYEQLRQAEKLAIVGKLAAGVAHSVRNPLTSVKLRLFSLERSLRLTPQQQSDITAITEAMQHVDAIVSNFLEFSRRPNLNLQPASLCSIVDASCDLLNSRLTAFPVSLTRKKKAHLPEIKADKQQLREVLLNILLNACEAMDYSGTLIITETMAQWNSKPMACIIVQDSGPGISEEDLQHIFTPFFSTKDQGTGLGLPIAKSIVEEHGGDIVVTSSPQTGTIFYIYLPLPDNEMIRKAMIPDFPFSSRDVEK